MKNDIISLNQVHKSFSHKPVLKGLSFSVKPGELVALLGANGAGKTTTMNILLGLEQADSGTISILGQQPGTHNVKLDVGVTPQGTDFPEGLKVIEVLELVAAHYKNAMSIEQTIAQFSLEDIAGQLTAGLSYGQKRRVAVALAFIGHPKLIFLDEPTTGLDVQSRHALWSVIKDYVQAGGTLVLTTHYLEEAEKLATKILVLDDGVIRSQGTVNEIIADFGMMSVTFQAEQCPQTLTHASKIQHEDDLFVIETTDSDALVRELVDKSVAFRQLAIHKSSLETAFLEMNQSGE